MKEGEQVGFRIEMGGPDVFSRDPPPLQDSPLLTGIMFRTSVGDLLRCH